MQDSLFTLFDKIEARLDNSKDDEAEGDQVSSDQENLDVMADSKDQVCKEVKQRLKDLVEIFEGPTHFFISDSFHDRATRLLGYLHDNA